MSFMTLLAFAAGYLLRHMDILRIHLPPNPLSQALQDLQKRQAANAQAELLARLQSAADPAAGSSPPSSGS